MVSISVAFSLREFLHIAVRATAQLAACRQRSKNHARCLVHDKGTRYARGRRPGRRMHIERRDWSMAPPCGRDYPSKFSRLNH